MNENSHSHIDENLVTSSGGVVSVYLILMSFLLLFSLTACQPLILSPKVLDQISPPADSRTFRLFIEGQLRLEDGNYDEAAKLFAEATAAEPQNSTLILAHADALLRAEEDAAALHVVESALLTSPLDIDLLLFLGNFHFSRDEVPEAITFYQKIYDIAPEQENGAFHLVLATIKSGDLDRAAAVLIKMLEFKPQYPVAELMLARIYREKGDFPAAAEILHRIETREPELDTPLLELGALYESRQDWNGAIGYYRTAVNLNPGNIAVRHHLARLYVQQNDLPSALAELREILFQNPGDLDARRKIGLIHLERKEYPDAIQVFKSLIESAPELDEVRFYLGTAYERLGEIEQSLSHFEAVSEDSGIYNDALMHRALILQRLKRLDTATELLEERLIRGEDVSPEICLYLVSLYEMRGMNDQVLATLSKTRDLFAGNAEVAYRLGLLYDRHGQSETALVEMRRVLSINPQHAEALNYLAYYYADRRENLDEALDLAQRAMAVKAEPYILDTLGWVWFARGGFEQAREFLAEAIKKAGDDPIILEHYGDALYANKAEKEAIVIYQRSLAVKPDNEILQEKLKKLLPVVGQ